jgi:hypothetical protein
MIIESIVNVSSTSFEPTTILLTVKCHHLCFALGPKAVNTRFVRFLCQKANVYELTGSGVYPGVELATQQNHKTFQ